MIAVIGGSGARVFPALEIIGHARVGTPYGAPSASVTTGRVGSREILFLPRHGDGHTIPPHRVNYRANLRALQDAGAERVIALNAVGAVNTGLRAPQLALPTQLIDYTWGREHTFFDGGEEARHVDFSFPYTPGLVSRIETTADELGLACRTPCVYAAMQGPRFETCAEIDRLERDGVDVVGMTGMPEAALARELGLEYASICIVVNPAAGRGAGEIDVADIERHLATGVADAFRLVTTVIARLGP